jgi:hypothetical protein
LRVREQHSPSAQLGEVSAASDGEQGQWCTWRRSRQIGSRGAVGERPEERSMVPVDGSAGNAVAGLGCGVVERRGAADGGAHRRGALSGSKVEAEKRCGQRRRARWRTRSKEISPSRAARR